MGVRQSFSRDQPSTANIAIDKLSMRSVVECMCCSCKVTTLQVIVTTDMRPVHVFRSWQVQASTQFVCNLLFPL